MLYNAVTPRTLPFFDRSVAQALLDGLLEEDEYGDDEPVTEGSEEYLKRELLAKHVASWPR